MKKRPDWILYLLAASLFALAGAIDLASDRKFDAANLLQFLAAAIFVVVALQARPRS